ncbi:MAG: HesA/MoeB/ThiF family protein [Spirochaetes bacterium]|nr:HesA/MoeB/ThiF family protein [Spirochaetota bacterium]
MKNMFDFKEDQIERYSRQILLKEIGGKGVRKLLEATVGIIGAGGLGCPAIQILAAVGVGHLKIFDGDRVEISNLPRQFLHYTSDIGLLKVDSIKRKINEMNPDVYVEHYNLYINKSNITRFLTGCDYIIEASDNFATKFLVNDACVHLRIPFTIAGVVMFYGQLVSVIPGKTACYRCVVNEPLSEELSMNCASVGVLGTVPALAATIQANEAIKSILGLETRFTDQLFLFDLLHDSFEFMKAKINPECKACSDPETPFFQTENYGQPGNTCT